MPQLIAETCTAEVGAWELDATIADVVERPIEAATAPAARPSPRRLIRFTVVPLIVLFEGLKTFVLGLVHCHPPIFRLTGQSFALPAP